MSKRSSSKKSKSGKGNDVAFIITILIIIVCLGVGFGYGLENKQNMNVCFNPPKENFKKDGNGDLAKQVKDLDLVFVYSDRCGFCKKMDQTFKDAGVDPEKATKKVTSDSKLAKEHNLGTKGVPHIMSLKNKKEQVGYVPKLEDLLEKLS